MMKNKIKLVAFDMAGTTVRDEHEVEHCFRQAALQTGLEMSEAEILAVQGWGKRFVFETYWERQLGQRDEHWLQQVDHSFHTFTQILENHYHTQPIVPTEGALEVFAFLREKGIKIALTTGFYRKVTDIILDRLGWLQGLNEQYVNTGNSLIDCSISSDQVVAGRPAPDMIFKAMHLLQIDAPAHVISVGDTPSDIQAGQNAQLLHSLAVANGTHPAELLLPHHPTKMLDTIRDLIPYLEENDLC
jgi:phosphonatase-like hydrolase